MPNLPAQVAGEIRSAGRAIRTLLSPSSGGPVDLYEIGKPRRFTEKIDRQYRMSRYLQSKMNIVDIVPCDYVMPITRATEVLNNSSGVRQGITPAISYSDAIERFSNICEHYGLIGKSGIRFFITDETTSTEGFSSSYRENVIGQKIDSLRGVASSIRDIGRSVTSQYEDAAVAAVNQAIGAGANTISSAIGTIISSRTEGDRARSSAESIVRNTENVLRSLTPIIVAGHRVSFPKIWDNTNHDQTLNCNIKLVSPYGHPAAIKKFIIEPLMYLLIMCSPFTEDGLSYGDQMILSVRAYGIANYPLAVMKDVTIRRGGTDTSFNIFRQPLSIDVNVSFQTLVDGFALFKAGTQEQNLYSNLDFDGEGTSSWANSAVPSASSNVAITTMGTIVESLKPVSISHAIYERESGNLRSERYIALTAPEEEEEVLAYEPSPEVAMDQTEEVTEHITAQEESTELAEAIAEEPIDPVPEIEDSCGRVELDGVTYRVGVGCADDMAYREALIDHNQAEAEANYNAKYEKAWWNDKEALKSAPLKTRIAANVLRGKQKTAAYFSGPRGQQGTESSTAEIEARNYTTTQRLDEALAGPQVVLS